MRNTAIRQVAQTAVRYRGKNWKTKKTPKLRYLRPKVPGSSVVQPRTTKSAREIPDVSFTDKKMIVLGKGSDLKRLPNFWLRDNCRCSKCVNQDTMQRGFNTFELARHTTPCKVTPSDDGLKVIWAGDNHESHYTWDFLLHYLGLSRRPEEQERLLYWPRDTSEKPGIFREDAGSWPPQVAYEQVNESNEGLGKLLDNIRGFGFAFVTGVPYENADPTKALLERIGPIRETHYGGFYDFIPDLAKADTAYTNLALAGHTDTTYFTEPARLQAFHLLSHTGPKTTDNEGPGSELGGKSLLVDGFRAAYTLKKHYPKAYDVLRTVRVPWHASGNEGINIAPRRLEPVIEIDITSRKVMRIRWNNDDRGVVHLDHKYTSDEWYDAAFLWDSILRKHEWEYWFQLMPGRVLIFDNWRVLHGRSAFQGVRRICGGYINHDDFMSRWRNTNLTKQEILNHVVG